MDNVIIVRGAGDLASGIIYKLNKSGFKIIALEIDNPTSIRRKVSFSEAIYDEVCNVEDLEAVKCKTIEEVKECLDDDNVAVMVDPKVEILNEIKPIALVDSILAKKNIGTRIDMADIVIGVGPGFYASSDSHAVIETKRGHDLGKIYYKGSAKENTGVPGDIAGYSKERVFHSPADGIINNYVKIGDIVEKNEKIFSVNGIDVLAPFSGVIRGVIKNGFKVHEGMKVADIDPRLDEVKNCITISEKARCIAGGVLEAILNLKGGIQ
ncbi:EF2563 family selenium-dependent molybdenum hydroxylase system protein [Mycoplasmatota bacterium]|nr:EF2563 family selenium-dependent molybdenum hydroxylase system protein [Mycoplasmatota bacterium]